MPLTIKSIKGYIYHQILIKKNTSDDKKKYTYWIAYGRLACALNEHFKPDVKITRKDFVRNFITDARYLSFCYSLLQNNDFQNAIRSDVKTVLRRKHEDIMGVNEDYSDISDY